ncbi:MAG TPA: hypothetical protein DCG72_01510 [Gammaproteobacteria bacterium]|nr:hypothetical protein [Gammaproteobacteria bacterium]
MIPIYQFSAVIFLSAILFISGCSQSSTDGGLLNQEPGADIDGDGILNENDVDVDGDGIPNALDPDDDNDGVLDELDLVPQPDPSAGVCKYLDIIPPNDEQVAGSTVIVKWKLYGANGLKKCVAPDSGRRDRALAYNNAALIPNPSKSVPVEVGARSAALKLPDWCNSKQAITYSLEGLAALVGQTDQSKGAFEALISHPPRSCSDGGETSCPDSQVIVDGQCVTPGGPEAIDCEAGEIEVNGRCEVPGGEGSYCPEGQVEIDGVCEIPSEGSDPNCPEGEIPIDGYCKVPDTGIDQPTPGLGCPGDLQEADDGSCQCSGDLIPDDDNPLSCVAPWPLPNECAADEELIDGKCVSSSVCGVSNLHLWASGNYDTATVACANYLNDGISRRIATLEEAQCLCTAKQLENQFFWTSTEYKDDFTGEKDGTYWTIQGSSCRLNSNVPTTALAAVCVTD